MKPAFTRNVDLRPGRFTIVQLLERTRSNWAKQDWARANAQGKPFNGDKGLVYKTKLDVQRPSWTPYGIRFQTSTTDPVEFGVDENGRYPRKHVQYIQLSRSFAATNVRGEKTFQVFCTCLSGDTRVLTIDGWKSMYSLAVNTNDPTKLPLSVDYVINGEVHKGTPAFRTGKKPVWKVTLDNGYSFTATKDHQVLVYRGYDSNRVAQKRKGYNYTKPRHWVEVGDLSIGSMIVQNYSNGNIPIVDTHSQLYKESYLAGAFYGDGTYNPFSLAVKAHFTILDRIREVDPNIIRDQGDGRYMLNQTAREIFAKLGMQCDSRHVIPTNIEMYGFLSGLIDTDGCVHVDNSVAIYGRASMKPLADMLIAAGIHGVKFTSSGARNAKGFVTNMGARSHDQYKLVISAQGMRQIRKNIRSIKYDKVVDKNKPQKRQCVAKVVSITYAGRQYVYDITVPSISRFVAESVIVHNCPRFKFYHHYVLHRAGHAPQPYGRGNSPPVRTNPYQRIGMCKHAVLALLALNRMSQQNKIPQALPESKWREIELYWQKIEREGWNGPASVPPKIKAIAKEIVRTGKAPRGTPKPERTGIKDFANSIAPPKRVS